MQDGATQNTNLMTGSSGDYRTRSRLLEAAGRVFAEKGYDRATGREICELAQVNAAAISYHFGGKDKLYIEALREADRSLLSPEVLKTAAAGKARPEKKLRAFLTGLLRALLSPSPESWGTKLIAREMTAPTKSMYEMAEREMSPNMRILRHIVALVMDLDWDHPAVIRGCLIVMSQGGFVFQNRSMVEHVVPELEITPAWVEEFARDVTVSCVAGLRAIAREVPRKRGK